MICFYSFLRGFSLGARNFKKMSDPFICQKNCSDYRVHGIQIDRLGLTISTQKSVLKNMHRVPRYYQKSVQNRPSKPNLQNLIHFGRYFWPRYIFLHFALKPWVQAGWFEYHEPHNLNNFFSPFKGSQQNFGGNSGGLRKLRFGWFFLWAYHLILNGKMVCFYSFLTFQLFWPTLISGLYFK